MKKITSIILLILSMNNVHAQNFSPMPPGFNFLVRSLCFDSITNLVYAGGGFSNLGNGETMNQIARWNGVTWDSLGSGGDGQNVLALAIYNGELIVGGTFSNIGGVPAKGLAKWNGSNWQFLADATDQFGYACVGYLYVYGNDLYVGGCFDSINGMPAQGIARYDGTSWYSYPPLDIFNTAFVRPIIKYNNELYVGGRFNAGMGMSGIAKFNGSIWVTVGGGFMGINSGCNDFSIFQNNLYVIGNFELALGDPGNNIAIWNGTNWSQALNGLSSTAFCMHTFNNELYVGGPFTSASGIPVTYIAKWNGSNWLNVGSFFDNVVNCFASNGSDLYVGGSFITIDADSMMCIARYSSLVGIKKDKSTNDGINTSFNHLTGVFSINSLLFPLERIQLFDLSGSIVFSIGKILNNSYQCKLNLPDGIYVAEVLVHGSAYRNKVLVMH